MSKWDYMVRFLSDPKSVVFHNGVVLSSIIVKQSKTYSSKGVKQ